MKREMKPIALVMNLFVAGVAFYHYWRQGHFNARLFLYFALGSIPFSFIGGYLQISPFFYNSILAIFLIFAITRLSGVLSFNYNYKGIEFNVLTAITIGSIIGFSSGLIGIGGGIILTPVILLLNWSNVKEAASVSALFIWVNSFSGLGGQILQGVSIPQITWPLVAVAVIGGYLGSYLGAKKLNQQLVKNLLLIVLGIAFIKLIFSLWKMI